MDFGGTVFGSPSPRIRFLPRLLVVLWLSLGLCPLGAEAVWILQTGPDSVVSIPLDPVQMVDAWRGGYSDGTDHVWVYASQSIQFFPPRVPEVVLVPDTPWTVAFFYPETWTPTARKTWTDRWTSEFRTLFSLPNPGYPIVFPSILKKD